MMLVRVIQRAILRAEDIQRPVRVSVVGQGSRTVHQFHSNWHTAQGQDFFQVVDADQRDVVVDFLGVRDEVRGAIIALAGVEHRGHAVAAGGTHDRTDVFRRFGVEQPNAAVAFVGHGGAAEGRAGNVWVRTGRLSWWPEYAKKNK